MYPCSTKTREVLGNPSPTPKRFPETREISRGRSQRVILVEHGYNTSLLSAVCVNNISRVLVEYRHFQDFPPASPLGNLSGLGKSLGRRGWISQYLASFGGVQTFSSSSIHLQGWIRKSIPVGREGLTVLKSILPC